MKLKSHIIIIIAAVLLCCSTGAAQDMVSIAVRDFEGVIKAWTSKDYGLLWEYGTNVSKSVYTKNYFIEQISRPRTLTFKKAENLHINIVYPTLAYGRANLIFVDNILDDRRVIRQFQLVYEGGFFRTHLGDFLR